MLISCPFGSDAFAVRVTVAGAIRPEAGEALTVTTGAWSGTPCVSVEASIDEPERNSNRISWLSIQLMLVDPDAPEATIPEVPDPGRTNQICALLAVDDQLICVVQWIVPGAKTHGLGDAEIVAVPEPTVTAIGTELAVTLKPPVARAVTE